MESLRASSNHGIREGFRARLILVKTVNVFPWLIDVHVMGLVVVKNNHGTNVGDDLEIITKALPTLPGDDEVRKADFKLPFVQGYGFFLILLAIIGERVIQVCHVDKNSRTLALLGWRGARLRYGELFSSIGQLPRSQVGCLSRLLDPLLVVLVLSILLRGRRRRGGYHGSLF